MIVSLVFLCLCSVDHRDLHSFPTRRSSDLLLSWLCSVDIRFGTLSGSCSSGTLQGYNESGTLENQTGSPFRRLGIRRLDRKSTRLNSSHTVISYAVFCLKKKKKITTMTRTL